MADIPNSQKYPVSEEEMGKKYKTWTETLARHVVWLYQVGKEVGGEKFVEKIREKYYQEGLISSKGFMALTGTKPEDFKDCMNLPKLYDFVDEKGANYWNGYVENSPKAFEKEVYTCPAAKIWSKEPEVCSICNHAWVNGIAAGLNPKLKLTFTKLIPEGDNVCRYRLEMKK